MPDMIPTSTKVIVCADVPLDNKYNDTILFTSPEAQQGYFTDKMKYIYNGKFTYQRVQNKVNNFSTMQTLPNPRIEFSCRIPVNADKIYDCNYLCFCNDYDTRKWWYCFIKEINYINPNCCEIIYEIDAIQSFLFDFTVEKSFVEREHTETDGLFDYICLEDDICSGEYQLMFQKNIIEEEIHTAPTYDMLILTARKDEFITISGQVSGVALAGELIDSVRLFSGLYAFWATKGGAQSFLGTIEDNEDVQSDEVYVIFQFSGGSEYKIVNRTIDVTGIKFAPNDNIINGYKVHNKMLFQHPFRKILIKSSDSDQIELRPQLMGGDSPTFQLNKDTTYNGQIYCIKPLVRNNSRSLYSKDKVLYARGDVCVAWASNSFLNWWAQNKASVYTQFGSGVVNTLTGLFTAGINMSQGNALGAVFGAQNAAQGVRDMFQSQARVEDAKHLPDTMHGTMASIDYDFEHRETGFWIYDFVLDRRSLERIDEYFTRYGYKVNEIKIPTPFNGAKRKKFNYVKTVDVNISGSVPTPQMNIIKSAFDNGITFWHDIDSVGVYGKGENDV